MSPTESYRFVILDFSQYDNANKLMDILNYSVDTVSRYSIIELGKSNLENVISFLKELEI